MSDVNMTGDDAWAEETKNFKPAGVPPAAQPRTEAPVIEEPKADEPVKEETKTDADVDKAAQEAAEGKLPDWMQKRINRAKDKEAAADKRVNEMQTQMAAMQEEIAALKAPKPVPDKAPDPDDFDTTADYEAAKAAYKAKSEKQPEPAKPAPKADGPTLPAHIDPDDFAAATELFLGLDADTTDKLKSKDLPLNADIILAMHDAAEGDAKEAEKVAAFVIASPHVIKAINELKPRQRAAAFERAYSEFTGPKAKTEEPKPKKQSEAPEPPTRTRASISPKVAEDFRSFEQQRAEEEANKGRRPW